ncbi:hypothetical protein BC827DRAFT_1123277, partial [Russula dissimulans]
VFDYAVMSGGTVVPQHLWSPLGQDDWRRYVEQADFHMPVFFINANGALGVPLVNAAAGQMSLRGADQPAPLGDKTTTKILIGWPGYRPSTTQVQLRDQTPARSPITLERLVKHVASRVRQVLIVSFYPGQRQCARKLNRTSGMRARSCPGQTTTQMGCGTWQYHLQ